MSLPKIEDIIVLERDELKNEILVIKKELLQLRIKQAVKEPIKAHQFRHARHRLRQLLMIQQNS